MSLNPTGLPVTPIMRGTLNPQTSASRMPTRCPSAARAQARFTVTLDLPTPPLPDATAITVVSEPAKKVGCCCWGAAPPRRVETSEARCSSLIGDRETSTRSTPSSGASASVTSLVIRSLSGQPSIVIRTWTRTRPPSSTSMSRSMPMSSIGRPISGSLTLRSASRTWSCVTTG